MAGIANKNPGRIPNTGRGGFGAYEVTVAGRIPTVNNLFYTNDIVGDIEVTLSSERLTTYLDAARGKREKAIRLHA